MEFRKHTLKRFTVEDTPDVEDEQKILSSGKPLTALLTIPPQQQGFRDGKYIHISDLINKCPRVIAIHYVHKKQLYGMSMSHQLGFTFRQGEAMASYMEDHVKRTLPEHMYGGWSCKCGKEKRENTTYSKVSELECKVCGSGLDNYHELFVADEEYQISGSIDITLLFGKTYHVNELKSIKKDGDDGFVGLTQAKPIHRIQALFYVWLLTRAGKLVHPEFSVFYMNKAYGWRMEDQVKEYVINYKDYAHTLESYLDDAKDIKIAREGGPLPPRICNDTYERKAKDCELCTLCFNLED